MAEIPKSSALNPDLQTKTQALVSATPATNQPETNGKAANGTKENVAAPNKAIDSRDESANESLAASNKAGNGEGNPAESKSVVVSERLATTERSAGVIFTGQQNVSPARDSNKTAAGVDDQRPSQPPASKAAGQNADRYRAYTIEAAVSYTKNHAEQAAAVFRKKGLEVVIQDFFDERYTAARFRVLVGLFTTAEAAEAKAAQLGNLLMKGYRIIGL
jgi:hypothetical protein